MGLVFHVITQDPVIRVGSRYVMGDSPSWKVTILPSLASIHRHHDSGDVIVHWIRGLCDFMYALRQQSN